MTKENKILLKFVVGILVVIIIALLALTIHLYVTDKKGFYLLFYSEFIEREVIYSPSKENAATIILQTEKAFDSDHTIFIVDGTYSVAGIPEENFIKFPDSSPVHLEWKSDDTLTIYSAYEPEINTIAPDGYKVELIISPSKIRELESKGIRMILYEIF